MNIVDLLNSKRPSIDEIRVTPNLFVRQHDGLVLNNGMFSEKFVRYWFYRTRKIRPIRNSPNEYFSFLRSNTGGVLVGDREYYHNRVEFDNVIGFEGRRFVVEVKSDSLNGYAQKIPKILEFSENLFSDCRKGKGAWTGLLIFVPFSDDSNRSEYFRSIEDDFNGKVRFVDLGYTTKALEEHFKKIGYRVQ